MHVHKLSWVDCDPCAYCNYERLNFLVEEIGLLIRISYGVLINQVNAAGQSTVHLRKYVSFFLLVTSTIHAV